LDVLWENDQEQPGDTLELVVLGNEDVELAHLWWQAVDPRAIWHHEERWVEVPPEIEQIEFYFVAHTDEAVPSLFVVDNIQAIVCWPIPIWYLPVVVKG